MHAIANELRECDACFTPYYVTPGLDLVRKAGLLEMTIAGDKLAERCVEYLNQHGLRLDRYGRSGPYDLVLTCSDVVVPMNVRQSPLIAVQEGILDPERLMYRLVTRFPTLPRWLAGTAATGLSGLYERFCVASRGYKEHFASIGAPEDRLEVTGIPNFDDCEQYRNNTFPFRDYVLVCTSDARETFKLDDRKTFIERAVAIAAGRPLFFKLHPNENVDRSTREIERWAPGSRVFAEGNASEMVANCSVLIAQYSTLAFVGVALGKEVHSYYPLSTLRRLLPEQNRSASKNIANVCRQVLTQRGWVLRGNTPNVETAERAA
jgi:hypothetical protein